MMDQPTGEDAEENGNGAAVEAPATAAQGPPSRTRVLEAAARVFAAEGLDAPMPTVAAAAGVGVGTIYRAFGSKEELIAALAVDRIDSFGQRAAVALEATDAWQGLVDLLAWTAERQARDRVVTVALVSMSRHPKVVAAQQRVLVAVNDLIARAQEQGTLRSDFAATDLYMFFAALGASQDVVPRDSRAWARLLGLLVDGLRAESAHPFAEPPLTREDVERVAVERSSH